MNSETAVLDRVLEPVARCFTPGVARQVADLRADPELQGRLDELADKCNEGELTEQERAEYQTYVQVIDFITVLQAKARGILRDTPHT